MPLTNTWRIDRERRRSPDGQHRRNFCDFAEHVPESRQRVTHRDRQQGGAIGTVQQIGPAFLVGDAATSLQRSAPRNQRGRQHVADEAVRDQMPQIFDLRSDTRLGSDHTQYSFCLREPGHFLGFGQAITQRPFAIDVLARADRRLHDLQVKRHFYRDGDDVDLRRRNQLGDVGEGPWQPGHGGGRFGAGFVRVGDTNDFEGLGESAQRGNVAACGPAPARLHADDTDPEALFRHGVPFSFASPCLENTPECSMRKLGIYASDR